jgi:hypothetical protein
VEDWARTSQHIETCRTNRDLYQRLVATGAEMVQAGRTLDEFLRAWWSVGHLIADRETLDLTTVAVMIATSAVIEPPPLDPRWRTATYAYDKSTPPFEDWEMVVLSQIADLADFADEGPLSEWAYFGIDAPRRDGVRRRTGLRWYNFNAKSYLECGMAGSLGGWDEDDGLRVPVPGPSVPLKGNPGTDGERILPSLTWTDLADIAINGQEYE